ncbi:lipoprotein [Polaromonas sp. YR568]|uniref:LPS translocon maturation chaperone LptM n=1 Tax=Polaromonas sp. YR568 TaxID=1855301 RepID=UPI003137A262
MLFSAQILGLLRLQTRRHGLAAFVVGALALAGCGQKGPLFLPTPPKAPAAASLPAPSAAPAASAAR